MRVNRSIFRRPTTRTGFALAFALGCSLFASAQARTYTTLSAPTEDAQGHATVAVSVVDEAGQPVSGAVVLADVSHGNRSLAGAALDVKGGATFAIDSLAAGDHSLEVNYNGDAHHAASISTPQPYRAATAAVPDFTIALSPTAITVPVGGTATTTITITPINGFTGFISLSCSGLPIDFVTCNNSPANLEINSAKAQTAIMNIQTTATDTTTAGRLHRPTAPGAPASGRSAPVLAVLLPGVALFGFLGRKRKHLLRASLMVLFASAMLFGATGCSARYWYLHLGPIFGGTPPGTYTIVVTAQTSNGVTAAEHSSSIALTVN